MEHEDEAGPDLQPPPFWQHRRWQLSAVFLAVAVCGGLVATVVGRDGSEPAGAAPGPVIGGLAADGSRPQQCRTDDSRQTIPVEAPRDITWWPLNGAQAPRSASAGPLKTTGPLRWCFARTPMGAVMAANVIPRQMSGPYWRVVTHQQVVPGFARDYFESMRESLPDANEKPTAIALVGFMVVDYSPDTAVIRLLVRQGTVAYASVDYTVDWDGVDWKLRALSTGGLYTEVRPVVSLVGFVQWKEE